MNKKVITTAATLTLAGLLSSCTTTQVNSAVAGIAGGLVGGAILGGGGNSAGRIIAAIAVTAITVAVIQHYQASQEQKRFAQSRAYAAAQRPHYASVRKEKKVRYVAVPVKKKSANEKSGIMLYDADNGQLASDKVYVPKAASLKKDSIVVVDGKQALLESSFTGA